MQDSEVKQDFEKLTSFNEIDVFLIGTDKFKTNTINFFFQDDLKKETSTTNALIPALLRRGSESFPTFKEIARRLQTLYGASFDCGIIKKGERQIIQFYMEFVSDQYTETEHDLFKESFDLLFEIITSPIREGGVFRNDYLELEKHNLGELIKSRINDKMQYAVERCLEEMCNSEPYSIYEYGRVEDLEKIDAEFLFKQYEKMLREFPLQVYMTGNIDKQRTDYAINRLKNLNRSNINNLKEVSNAHPEIKQVRFVNEPMEVSQGKLSMGFRTNVNQSSPEKYVLLLYNDILGGGIHSKLFQNVREKASLAYYVFSRLDRFKGLMVISSGIEVENREKAEQIIKEQLEEMKKGNISEYEMNAALKSIETGLRSLKDNQLMIVDFYLSQLVTGTDDSFDKIADMVKKVKKEEIVKIAEKVELDTVYFLKGIQPEQAGQAGQAEPAQAEQVEPAQAESAKPESAQV